jgi:hypothetical protein
MTRLKLLAALAAVLTFTGCVSQLSVRKVPLDRRVEGRDDHIHGFRYYLSRPYVLVKEPILVSREVQLKYVDPCSEEAKVLGFVRLPSEVTMTEAVCTRAGDGVVEPMSQDQWASMRRFLEAKTQAAVRTRPSAQELADIAAGDNVFEMTSLQQAGFQPSSREDIVDANPGFLYADETKLKAPSGADTVTLEGPIDIVFLPDMDEQYAVHNRNWLAKSSYDLQFKDGWKLEGVDGSFDSTTVAIALLETIDSALSSAKKVALAGIETRPGAVPLAAKEDAPLPYMVPRKSDGPLMMEVHRETYILPGLYRINKPWEMGGIDTSAGCGFLTKLGLDTVTMVAHRPASVGPSGVLDQTPITRPAE